MKLAPETGSAHLLMVEKLNSGTIHWLKEATNLELFNSPIFPKLFQVRLGRVPKSVTFWKLLEWDLLWAGCHPNNSIILLGFHT